MRAVVFDFGYTLVNEDRVWSEIAAQYGWPESVFFATLGAVIERREHHEPFHREHQRKPAAAGHRRRRIPVHPGDPDPQHRGQAVDGL